MKRHIRFLMEKRSNELLSPETEAETKKPEKTSQPEKQKPREVLKKNLESRPPRLTSMEAGKEADGFLAHLKYLIKKGRPLEEAIRNIREDDIGKNTLERRNTLARFNELVAKHRIELIKLEEEIRKLKRSDQPERQKPLEVVDPLRILHEKRPGD